MPPKAVDKSLTGAEARVDSLAALIQNSASEASEMN